MKLITRGKSLHVETGVLCEELPFTTGVELVGLLLLLPFLRVHQVSCELL